MEVFWSRAHEMHAPEEEDSDDGEEEEEDVVALEKDDGDDVKDCLMHVSLCVTSMCRIQGDMQDADASRCTGRRQRSRQQGGEAQMVYTKLSDASESSICSWMLITTPTNRYECQPSSR